MPRIPDVLQQSVVFLYPDKDAAEKDDQAVGTGFFVRLRHAGAAESTQYLVTNIHVAHDKNRTVRITTTGGEPDFYEIQRTDWVNHPNGDDIAAVALPSKPDWKINALDWTNCAATRLRMTELNVGVGDEVFMLGRFSSHGDAQLQAPLARFGNIAMMPGPLVKDGRDLRVEAFLVEMRSQSGFSGSPVFIYIGPGTYRGNGTMMRFFSESIGLIGIDTGHKTTLGKVLQSDGSTETDLTIKLNTGVSIVAPVWKIDDLLATDR